MLPALNLDAYTKHAIQGSVYMLKASCTVTDQFFGCLIIQTSYWHCYNRYGISVNINRNFECIMVFNLSGKTYVPNFASVTAMHKLRLLSLLPVPLLSLVMQLLGFPSAAWLLQRGC